MCSLLSHPPGLSSAAAETPWVHCLWWHRLLSPYYLQLLSAAQKLSALRLLLPQPSVLPPLPQPLSAPPHPRLPAALPPLPRLPFAPLPLPRLLSVLPPLPRPPAALPLLLQLSVPLRLLLLPSAPLRQLHSEMSQQEPHHYQYW